MLAVKRSRGYKKENEGKNGDKKTEARISMNWQAQGDLAVAWSHQPERVRGEFQSCELLGLGHSPTGAAADKTGSLGMELGLG